MGRRHLEAKLSHQEPGVTSIWDWYQFQCDLLAAEEQRVFADGGLEVLAAIPRYRGRTRLELIDLFAAQRAETNQAAILQLLAATEAALRVDVIKRLIEKKRTPISRSFANLYKSHRLRLKLGEHLLGVHREHGSPNTRRLIDEFVEALKMSHWLAHGRYWPPRFQRPFDPDLVFRLCHDLLAALSIE